jgi:Domain of unknown function (DUF1924)
MNKRYWNFSAAVVLLLAPVAAFADPARDAIVSALAEEAKAQDAGFTGFSAERGQTFWTARHTGGKPDTPSCTACHGPDPAQSGQTRVGKPIDPMAVSKAPKRFTNAAQVDKWFTRNCSSVLGRECSALEKGDVIAYLSSK